MCSRNSSSVSGHEASDKDFQLLADKNTDDNSSHTALPMAKQRSRYVPNFLDLDVHRLTVCSSDDKTTSMSMRPALNSKNGQKVQKPREQLKDWQESSSAGEPFHGLSHPERETPDQRKARLESEARKCEDELWIRSSA